MSKQLSEQGKIDFMKGFIKNPEKYVLKGVKDNERFSYIEVSIRDGGSFMNRVDERLLDDPLFDRIECIKAKFRYLLWE